MGTLNNRTGEESFNNFGSIMVITRYKNRNDIDVYFPKYDWTYRHANYDNFNSGRIKCPYEPRVYGVGFIGEGDYISGTTGKQTKSYKTWIHMLERCYDTEHSYKFPTYENCIVCDEWLNYQNFARWFDINYYEIEGEVMCLDKDILFKGNKIYSPKTCIFVPRGINNLFTKNDKCRTNLPLGVYEYKGKYRVLCSNGKNKLIELGIYDTLENAFNKYKEFKEKVIKQIADEYINNIPIILYEAMYNYIVEIND